MKELTPPLSLKKNGRRRCDVRRLAPVLTAALLLAAGCESVNTGDVSRALTTALGSGQGGMTTDTVIAGLKEALRVGTEKTVTQTSRQGGYSENEAIRITVPEKIEKMADALRKVGLGRQVDAFEAKMNDAAEQAAAEAAPVFVNAIKDMTFADARQILRGSDTAATEYFRENTSAELTRRYSPVVRKQMENLGVVRTFDDLQNRYNKLPLVADMNYQIEDYVVEEALNGLFAVLAKEEKAIRKDPAARTTALLKQVFGSQ